MVQREEGDVMYWPLSFVDCVHLLSISHTLQYCTDKLTGNKMMWSVLDHMIVVKEKTSGRLYELSSTCFLCGLVREEEFKQCNN